MRKIILTISFISFLVNYINAQTWSTLGAGIGAGYYHSVHAFATYNAELYAGGYFTSAGGMPANNIAKWNGTNWLPVGTGTSSTVRSLAVYNGELYAGGDFSWAGNVGVNHIAKWNGTNWSPVGIVESYYIRSMIVYNGELYAAGNFIFSTTPDGTSIAKWNGTMWSPVGNGVEPLINSVECLAVYNGDLYAAGANIGGGGVAIDYSILKWNGSNWSTLITIPASYTLDGALGDILSMKVYNGELYIAGNFTSVDTIATSQIAKWNGSNWSAVGTGINFGSYPYGIDGSFYTFVKSLEVYNGALFAAGWFSHCGTTPTLNIAKWDGTNWSALGQGVNWHVYALTTFDTSLNVGGWFDAVNGNNIPANNVAKWNMACSIAPEQPGSINGNITVCANSSATYNVNTVLGATSYAWTLPPGWTGNSTTNSITITAGTTGGTISVTANNSCGVSNAQSLTIALGPVVPGEPSRINGDSVVCENTLHTYSIVPIPGATNYIWTLPPGWSGSSTTNTITTTAASNGGIISVVASNDCGNSNAQTLLVTTRLNPALPGPINGANDICAGNTETYSIAPVAGATYYTWDLPQGWSGYSTSNSISVLAGVDGGILSVTASNNCGATIPQTIMISSITIPATPILITGNDTVCEGSSQTYFVDTVAGATGYAWDLTFGWVNSLDTNSVIIVVDQISMFGDFIAVSAYNNCGYSDAMILPVVVKTLPHYPNGITGNQIVCRGSTQTYFINPVYDATSYTWILPSGWTGISTTPSINVTAGNEPGDISVKANNSCGSRTSISLPIRLDTIPSKPGDITGNIYVNAGQSQSYSINLLNGVSGYNWSLSGGGNITTGQNTSKVEVNWQTPGTYVLSANVTNSCRVSPDQTITIKVADPNIDDPFSLQLFPNPSSGQFFLKAKRVQDKVISVEVLNMAGQLVFRSGKKQGANDYTQPINLDKTAAGIYAVKIMIDDKVYVRSVMIKH
jgi:hypothetical protein